MVNMAPSIVEESSTNSGKAPMSLTCRFQQWCSNTNEIHSFSHDSIFGEISLYQKRYQRWISRSEMMEFGSIHFKSDVTQIDEQTCLAQGRLQLRVSCCRASAHGLRKGSATVWRHLPRAATPEIRSNATRRFMLSVKRRTYLNL